MPRQQEELAEMDGPGVGAPKIKAIDDAFDALIGARSKRMQWGDKEKEAQTALVQLMHKHNIDVYVFDDVTYELIDIEKVRRKPKDAAESEE